MNTSIDRTLDHDFDPDLDLMVQRVIWAPREVFWSAWTEPSQLEQWWIPAPLSLQVDALDPVAMTTEIILTEHTGGTDYRAIVRHSSPEQRARHEELGFFDGWATVTDQLAESME